MFSTDSTPGIAVISAAGRQARGQPAGPALPATTSAAGHLQQRGGAQQPSAVASLQIASDACRSVVHTDVERPFSGISDAVHRLLPYHILYSPDADEVDEEEAAAAGRIRIAGRRDVGEELQLRCTAQLAAQIQGMEASIERLEQRVQNPGLQGLGGQGQGASEDAFLWEELLLKSLRAQLQPDNGMSR